MMFVHDDRFDTKKNLSMSNNAFIVCNYAEKRTCDLVLLQGIDDRIMEYFFIFEYMFKYWQTDRDLEAI